MPPPLPVPSKAAIHALRGIAFGTSCAIGAIIEDRRRKINTLRTALSNKEKLRSSKQYHGMAEGYALQLDEAVVAGDVPHWLHPDDWAERHRDSYSFEACSPRNSPEDTFPSADYTSPSALNDVPESSSSLITTQTETSIPPPVQNNGTPSLDSIRRANTPSQTRFNGPAFKTARSFRPGQGAVSTKPPDYLDESITKITSILASREDGGLDRALEIFFETSRSYYSFKRFDEKWITVSAQISKACQAEDRWDDANKVLATTVSAGPLDESQFYAHEPVLIIQFLLRQKGEDGRCPPEAISAATHIFLATFKEKPQMKIPELLEIARQLFSQNLLLNNPCARNVYWRVVGFGETPASFTGWAIREFYKYADYKNAVRYFTLNYSKMEPSEECYDATVTCVVHSVEGLKGLKARNVLLSLERMKRPGNGFLRSEWVMRLLQAHYRRHEDFVSAKALFEEILSLGLLDLIKYPQGPYRTMVEISVKAEEHDAARSYYKTLIQKYPDMTSDIPLRGFRALALAKAGDWDGVLEAFTEMQALKHAQDQLYDDAFVMVLKVYADNHAAAEVRDFLSKYTNDLGVRMHRYIVTLVANKYGQCHDIPGFISWLEYCSEAGFALDSGFCNSVLYNCLAKFGLSYNELRALYAAMRRLNPECADDVTRRIMSQAELTTVNGVNGVNASKANQSPYARTNKVKKLAYKGRTAGSRDIYEAMNQELNSGQPAAAYRIYKRALGFGMPPCRHCLRLAVLASLRSNQNGDASAMNLIRRAHERGEDVTSAVSQFIKYQLDHIRANAGDVLLEMRNLISIFESLHILIDTTVLTHMAEICTNLCRFDKAISLCALAKDKGGFSNLYFSRQSVKVLLMAYARLQDVGGMRELADHLPTGQFAADKTVLEYLRMTRRTVRKFSPGAIADELLNILTDTIDVVRRRRLEIRTGGKMIAQETLRIVQDAVANMEGGNIAKASESDAQEGDEHSSPGISDTLSPASAEAS
ncbi:hypothetical protein F5Y05DRAFT_367118 [Hypoxylon sp. FL0543]|nr:hypothetical protein F5Y05DRAFT_367118 [Hypoxylon sp. FL0543]